MNTVYKLDARDCKLVGMLVDGAVLHYNFAQAELLKPIGTHNPDQNPP